MPRLGGELIGTGLQTARSSDPPWQRRHRRAGCFFLSPLKFSCFTALASFYSLCWQHSQAARTTTAHLTGRRISGQTFGVVLIGAPTSRALGRKWVTRAELEIIQQRRRVNPRHVTANPFQRPQNHLGYQGHHEKQNALGDEVRHRRPENILHSYLARGAGHIEHRPDRRGQQTERRLLAFRVIR